MNYIARPYLKKTNKQNTATTTKKKKRERERERMTFIHSVRMLGIVSKQQDILLCIHTFTTRL
jgi:hypothetical protein